MLDKGMNILKENITTVLLLAGVLLVGGNMASASQNVQFPTPSPSATEAPTPTTTPSPSQSEAPPTAPAPAATASVAAQPTKDEEPPQADPSPTNEPAASPKASTATVFQPGSYVVPDEIRPGLYRTVNAPLNCSMQQIDAYDIPMWRMDADSVALAGLYEDGHPRIQVMDVEGSILSFSADCGPIELIPRKR